MKRVFVFAMFLWMGIMGASAQSNKFDLNDDGKVNVSDVTLLITYILGQDNGNGNGNGNGSNATGKAIDLGLPSGTKWASCNVGATKPEEYGGYYAWGETEEKEVYNEVTYQYATGEDTDGDGWYDTNIQYQSLGSDISGTEYDVARMKWGGAWRMPTKEECKELKDNCTSEWTTLNGVNGRKFTSNINGNSIFLPAAGYRWDGVLYDAGGRGYYWSSTLDGSSPGSAYNLYFRSGYASWDISSGRTCGQSVRPVVRN
jgi:hypothetical protein